MTATDGGDWCTACQDGAPTTPPRGMGAEDGRSVLPRGNCVLLGVRLWCFQGGHCVSTVHIVLCKIGIVSLGRRWCLARLALCTCSFARWALCFSVLEGIAFYSVGHLWCFARFAYLFREMFYITAIKRGYKTYDAESFWMGHKRSTRSMSVITVVLILRFFRCEIVCMKNVFKQKILVRNR